MANKFGVSSSTVSRVLKQLLSEIDYSQLMKWKRGGERGKFTLSDQLAIADSTQTAASETASDEPSESNAEADAPPTAAPTKPADQPKVEPTSADESSTDPEDPVAADETTAETAALEETANGTASTANDSKKLIKRADRVPEIASGDAAAWVSEDIDETYDEDAEDEDDWDDEAEDDWDDEAEEPAEALPQPVSQKELDLLSFADLAIQKPCYLVVDRLAELITCPLKDFSELGLIPSEEQQAKTLPVFDNHRVARRFARRNQRIIKVPDGVMLNKTQGYLQAKGITRILFDGQVYALN
ncbi:MAG: hypothetical protein ACFB12_11750 [Leptolyngbyaceae cyanobacterium]